MKYWDRYDGYKSSAELELERDPCSPVNQETKEKKLTVDITLARDDQLVMWTYEGWFSTDVCRGAEPDWETVIDERLEDILTENGYDPKEWEVIRWEVE